ncbi:MAG: hypothetical protein ACLS9Q_15250 [[Clostridium] scindens]|uniref:hypothetical protein n=1 Tax=Clostridium scindens (strain JCM 10418 / VPI 12708) TaxID=29347 RepID=UPI0039947077
MKKVISACIEQFIEFDTEAEYKAYERKLSQGKKKYEILSVKSRKGRYFVHLKKQYNNNSFLGGGENV